MNKKVLQATIQLKQNNRRILKGVVQYDTGVILDIRVMDGLTPFNFSGYGIVTIKIVRPDETIYIDSNGSARLDTIDAKNGRFKIEIPASCTSEEGMHFVTLGFGTPDSKYYQTVGFNYFVGEDATIDNDEITESNEYPVLTNLIAEFSGMSTTLAEWEQEELERQMHEDAREQRWAELEAELASAVTEASVVKAMLNLIIQTIIDSGVVLPISVDTSDLVLESELTATLSNYATNASVTQRIMNLGLPEVVAMSAPPTNSGAMLWIDISGSYPVIKYKSGNNWVPANVAIFA